MEDEDGVSNIFRDLHVSVCSKAAAISQGIDSGSHSVLSERKSFSGDEQQREKKGIALELSHHCKNDDFCLPITHVSTPKPKSFKNKVIDGSLYNEEYIRTNYSEKNNVSPIPPVIGMRESSYTPEKLLLLCDKQRSSTVEKVIMERIQNMHETERLMHENLEHLWQARQEEANTKQLLLEQKILDDIHEQEMKNRPKREAQLAKDNLKNAQRVLERMQRVKNAENEAKKKSEALQLLWKLRDKIYDKQKEYGQQYREIVEVISTCQNKNSLVERCGTIMKDLKNCSAEYENLLKKSKAGAISEDDVTAFASLVESLKQLYKNIKHEVELMNEETSRKEKVQETVLPKEPETVETVKESDQPDLSDCFDSQSLQLYLNLKTYMENFDKSCKTLIEDNSMKTFRFNCQKAVTIPVNAISPISSAHLSDKYQKLHKLLSGKTVDVGGVQLSAAQHPEGIAFCKQLLAKKFVRQGDLTVSSKPDAAFSIATVLASLWVDFPDFGQLTLAYFQNSCPYLAPVFMPQVEGQSVEDYLKSLGYRYTDSGEVEKQDSFLKRMSGIMRLYAAVLVSKVRQPGKQNPLGVSEGWRWMSCLLNLEPRPDICATLLFDFLEVAGNEMFKAYGAQFKKLLAYICQVYFPRLEKVTPTGSGGPLVRLEQFLQKIMKNGSIPSPEGRLPPNFW